ncbi:hypothetical protein BOTBODRAFT_360492 [Botryobasidium botryosum FD-172 SS1]|uniref:Uncharacterized protein n=1 Tax=Botryobasidium botryosum (strain FD-172 SS1) TaxID=930990 RepID=A0A067MDF8_BOTB1|nr:hypothetical protein BOTBODRAFT_360492 [Botryobasidium botryosum FD-172 SS1]
MGSKNRANSPTLSDSSLDSLKIEPAPTPSPRPTPLAKHAKLNGISPTKTPARASPRPVTPRTNNAPQLRRSPNKPLYPPNAPAWIRTCLETLKAEHPHDDFFALPRPVPPNAPTGAPLEWRLKCVDCPGKLYTPGPEESLQNFEVHLKNRMHRGNVNKRIQNQSSSQRRS